MNGGKSVPRPLLGSLGHFPPWFYEPAQGDTASPSACAAPVGSGTRNAPPGTAGRGVVRESWTSAQARFCARSRSRISCSSRTSSGVPASSSSTGGKNFSRALVYGATMPK